MNTTRTLALAAVAALSLGIGTAMAQEGGNYGDTFGAAATTPPLAAQAPLASQTMAPNVLQSGSSDVNHSARSMTDGSGAQTDSAYFIGGGEN